MKLRFQSLVFAIFLLLLACAPTNLDSDLFSGKPCKAPCWQNLTPGQSTEDDVNQFINGPNGLNWPETDSKVYDTGCKEFLAWNLNERVALNIQEGKLMFIETSDLYLTNLQELVDHLGPPEYFEAVLATGADGSTYFVEVYYPSQGLAFIATPDQNDVGYVKPTMSVSKSQYFAPGTMFTYLIARSSCFVSQSEAMDEAQREIAKVVQPWSGFGAVKVTP